MKEYLEMMKHVLDYGTRRPDRTGTGTISIFGHHTEYDMFDRFPLLTTKKIFWKGVVHEMLWFLQGGTNVSYLKDNGVNIWNEWADENGELGPVYGYQWRNWNGEGYDQIERVVQELYENPFSRRHVVSAWNVAQLGDMALEPCHVLFQFYVREMHREARIHALNRRLGTSLPTISLFGDGISNRDLDVLGAPKYFIDTHLYQRSADIFLGVPFNIASYALLTRMIANVLSYMSGSPGYEAGRLYHSFGDLHLYLNHATQARIQLTRTPKAGPKLVINPQVHSLEDFRFEDFILLDYDPDPAIKGEISV